MTDPVERRVGAAGACVRLPAVGQKATPRAIRDFAAQSVARFKAPQAALVCDRLGRHPSGKADDSWAREAALGAVPATDDGVIAPLG